MQIRHQPERARLQLTSMTVCHRESDFDWRGYESDPDRRGQMTMSCQTMTYVAVAADRERVLLSSHGLNSVRRKLQPRGDNC
jgi:hypothetical protein